MDIPLGGLIEEVEIKKIRPFRRSLRSRDGAIEELMASILEKGLLQPIIVRPSDSGYEVVAGNRRFEASKRLKMTKILCNIVDLDDKEAYETALMENVQHRTLTPVDEGEAFRRYVDEYGYGGMSDLARKLGKSQSYVSRRIALLDLPREFQQQLVRQRISPSVAQEILSLDDGLKRRLTDLIVNESVTRSQIRHIVRQVRVTGSTSDISFYALQERRQYSITRTFGRYIICLRLCLLRLDEVINSISDDEWVVKDMLTEHRRVIHNQIDHLVKMKRMEREPPR